MNGLRWILWLGWMMSMQSLCAQVYIVNTADDTDDGSCTTGHCSFREAIHAANGDGVASRIEFNIPGMAPHQIIPNGPFPNVTDPFLTVAGETQPGPLGSIVINFAFRNFSGASFWNILSTDVFISGLTFSNFGYSTAGDEVLRVGDFGRSADRFSLYNCAFTNDNLIVNFLDLANVHIFNSSNALVRKNIFGSDYGKSTINTYFSSLMLNQNLALKPCVIDSNIFVSSRTALNARGGDLNISKNIFGALDTSKANTFTNQETGIAFDLFGKYSVTDNFFIFHIHNAITNRNLGINDNVINISGNRFFNFKTAISLFASAQINNNYAANILGGFNGRFSTISSPPFFNISVNLENNQTENLQNFYELFGNANLMRSKHSKNRIYCNENNPVNIAPFIDAIKPPVPVIVSVNPNLIKGTARPNDSISIYENTRRNCPSADCRGGVEIGRTLADASGNWILARNFTAGASLSAYVWNNNNVPLVYSEFSNCYRCTPSAPIPVSAAICEGETFTFRSRVYSASKTSDTITIPGDGIIICDSVFHVNLTLLKPNRVTQNVNVCFDDTLRIAGIKLYAGKLIDSATLKNANQCDSTIVFNGTLVGYRSLTQTICSNSSLTIGNTTFDKNKTKGRVRLAGQASGACDSIIDVNIIIKDYAEHFLNLTKCPGEDTLLNGKLYHAGNPSVIDTLKGASTTGCDSIIHVDLKYPNTTSTFNTTICNSDSVFIVKEYFSARKPNGQIVCHNGEACASVFGCDSIINVTLNFIPDAIGSYRADICGGDTLTLPGFPGEPFFSGHTTGTLKMVNGATNGCDSIINVSVNIIPDAIGTYRADICRGDTLTLPGFPGEPFFSGHTTGTLKMVNGADNGCDSLIEVNLNVLPDAIGSFDTVLCENQTLNFYGNLFDINKPSDTIQLKKQATFGCDSFIMVRIQFNSESVGIYNPLLCPKDSVRVGNQFYSPNHPSGSERLPNASATGCDSVVKVNINLIPDIVLDFRTNDLLCNRANSGQLIIDKIIGGNGTLLISIDNGTALPYQAGMVVPALSIGNHSIRVIDQMGCDASSNFTINNATPLSLSLPQDTTIKKGISVDITAKLNFNPGSISWIPTDFLNCTNCLDPVSTPDQTITYTLILTDENDCEIQDQITITVIAEQADVYFPNAFSPNGDQVNDLFFPVFKFPITTTIQYFQIYDRWGELVFERRNGLKGEVFEWNGMYNNHRVLPGVYVYSIQFMGDDHTPQNRTGEITLLR
ncbi:MAG: gliding motility-associated C-terminal domain-containing protein [Saprospiraceae bacterium]|nr:gliding motility-associated C-terminal domain-containing protein [Candidatus Defluviibacterium haderslevense]